MNGEDARTDRPGFTLVELLIVVVVVGILAAIAIYRTTEVTRQAQLAVVKSDLRSFTVAQEVHHQSSMAYGGLEDLAQFRSSDGVSVQVNWVDPNGYAATATHESLPDVTCGVFRGPAAEGVAGPAEQEGVVTCE